MAANHVAALGAIDCEAARALSTLAGSAQESEALAATRRKRSHQTFASTAETSRKYHTCGSGHEDDSSHSTASTDEKHDYYSDDQSDSDEREFCDEEVEAASSLATIFHAAISGKQPTIALGSSDAVKGRRKGRPASASSVSDQQEYSSSAVGLSDVLTMKKLRRREKNRASAQQSRQRKKCHMEALEGRVHELEQDNLALLTRMKALAADNAALRARLGLTASTVTA